VVHDDTAMTFLEDGNGHGHGHTNGMSFTFGVSPIDPVLVGVGGADVNSHAHVLAFTRNGKHAPFLYCGQCQHECECENKEEDQAATTGSSPSPDGQTMSLHFELLEYDLFRTNIQQKFLSAVQKHMTTLNHARDTASPDQQEAPLTTRS
jgi:hypothetical protein